MSWNPEEKEVVSRLSISATKAVHAEINRKSAQIYNKFDHILHPFQKRTLDKNSSRIKQAITDHLYKSFGSTAIQNIPFSIKASLHKTSTDLSNNFQNIPPGYQFTNHQVQQLSAQVAYKTQKFVKNGVGKYWDSFQQTERRKGMKDLGEDGLVKRDGSLNKRDILDKIRARFKFFQIDPEKKWWVVPLISFVIIIFTFALLLPEMTLAIGLWQTIIQFAFIQPIISKLFLGYYYYNSKGNSVGPRVPSPGPIVHLDDHPRLPNSFENSTNF